MQVHGGPITRKPTRLAIGYETAFRLVDLTLVDTGHPCDRKGIEAPPVYQLVWPDPAHRFPWEQGFDETLRNYQTVLYAGGTTH